jgi:hypothetical protein
VFLIYSRSLAISYHAPNRTWIHDKTVHTHFPKRISAYIFSNVFKVPGITNLPLPDENIFLSLGDPYPLSLAGCNIPSFRDCVREERYASIKQALWRTGFVVYSFTDARIVFFALSTAVDAEPCKQRSVTI